MVFYTAAGGGGGLLLLGIVILVCVCRQKKVKRKLTGYHKAQLEGEPTSSCSNGSIISHTKPSALFTASSKPSAQSQLSLASYPSRAERTEREGLDTLEQIIADSRIHSEGGKGGGGGGRSSPGEGGLTERTRAGTVAPPTAHLSLNFGLGEPPASRTVTGQDVGRGAGLPVKIAMNPMESSSQMRQRMGTVAPPTQHQSLPLFSSLEQSDITPEQNRERNESIAPPTQHLFN